MSVYKYGKFTKSRVETFSDGVFAIIVTLLVLELKIPHLKDVTSTRELMDALIDIAPKFLSWVVSFAIVCVIWMNHHRLFEMFAGINNGLFWINANLLLWTSLIPFPADLMGDYPNNHLAVSFFGMIMFMAASSFVFMRFYLMANRELISEHVKIEVFQAGTRLTIIFGPLLYGLAAILAWMHPFVAFAIYGFIPIYFIFPRATRTQ